MMKLIGYATLCVTQVSCMKFASQTQFRKYSLSQLEVADQNYC